MISCLGENLKKLRRDKDLTQEELAEILNVSAQSISRWETNMGYPDIELLPALANFFGVSIDYLLGVDLYQKQERINDICNQIMECKRKGNREEAIKIAREGIKEYPNDFQILHLLASCLFNYGKNPEERSENQNEVIEICENILSGCHDDSIRQFASMLLCYTYPQSGRLEKAIELANKMPTYFITSNEILKNILKDDEKKKHVQGNFISILQLIVRNVEELFALSRDFDEKVKIIKASIKTFEGFFDEEDYYFFHCLIGPFYRYLAALYADQGLKDETISYLKKAAEHAISYDKRPQEYTYKSTFLKGYHDKRENVVTDSPISQSYNLLTKMSDQRYDFIRNDQEFVAIINKLKG